jgi:hypothetical protein
LLCTSDAHPHPRSADPFVQDLTNSQSFNAYAYVQNNPLSFTDPSGYFLSGLFKKIGRIIGNIARGFMSFAKAVARSTIGRAVLQIAACAFGGPAGCAAASAGLTLAAGGTLKQAFIGAAISFAQVMPGGIWNVVGDVVAATGTGIIGEVATHSIVSGAISMAQGGSFESGAISGAISAGAAGLSSGAGDVAQLVITSVAGGTASVLSGGKFANGAITGAFALMFNKWAHPQPQSITPEQAAANRQMLKSAAWALTPGSDLAECFSAQCSGWGWAAAAAGIIPGAGKALGLAAKFPIHHICTNKNCISAITGGPWTPRFQGMFDKAGMTLDDALNKVSVPGHRGPHPEAYHQAVFDRLNSATDGLSGSAYGDALRSELKSIGREVQTPGSHLNQLVTKP